jgi:hypothetical protein
MSSASENYQKTWNFMKSTIGDHGIKRTTRKEDGKHEGSEENEKIKLESEIEVLGARRKLKF